MLFFSRGRWQVSSSVPGQRCRGTNGTVTQPERMGCSQRNWLKLVPRWWQCFLSSPAPVESRVALVSGGGAWQECHWHLQQQVWRANPGTPS